MKEVWKQLPGYEDRYEVSCRGNVRSCRNANPVTKYLSVHVKFGYPKVFLAKDGGAKWFFIHRLVWMAHMGAIPEGLVVNHIDHDKGNPCLENLELTTQKENVRQATERFGHSSRGEKYKQTIAKRRAAKVGAA